MEPEKINTNMSFWLSVVVAAPAHSGIGGPLTYRSELPLAPGQLVRVPLGRREVLGVVWETLPDSGSLAPGHAKTVLGALDGLLPLIMCHCRHPLVRARANTKPAANHTTHKSR